MRMLLVLAVIAAAGYYFFFRAKPDVEIVASGASQTVVMRQDGGKAEYAVGEPYEETLMLFGAEAGSQKFAHAWLSGLTTRTAAFLLRQYPQLAKCGAPGSKEAIASLKHVEVVASEPALRERLVGAVRLHDERFKAKGDRVCLRIGGNRLTLTSAELEGGVPFQMQKPPDWYAVLASSVESFDCATIVGPS